MYSHVHIGSGVTARGHRVSRRLVRNALLSWRHDEPQGPAEVEAAGPKPLTYPRRRVLCHAVACRGGRLCVCV